MTSWVIRDTGEAVERGRSVGEDFWGCSWITGEKTGCWKNGTSFARITKREPVRSRDEARTEWKKMERGEGRGEWEVEGWRGVWVEVAERSWVSSRGLGGRWCGGKGRGRIEGERLHNIGWLVCAGTSLTELSISLQFSSVASSSLLYRPLFCSRLPRPAPYESLFHSGFPLSSLPSTVLPFSRFLSSLNPSILFLVLADT